MMWGRLLAGMGLFVVLHTLVWFSTNLQFTRSPMADRSLMVAMVLAIPATMCAYYGNRLVYTALYDSAWAARFIGFGTSYLVFPLLTWYLLSESMLTPKTLTCIALSVIIVCIQIFWN